MIHPTQKRLDILYIVVVISLLSVFAYTETERKNDRIMAYKPKNTIVDPATIRYVNEKQDSLSFPAYVSASKTPAGNNSFIYN